MATDLATKQAVVAWNSAQQNIQSFAANPSLNPKPAAGHDRTHQRWKIRSVRAVTCPRKNREGNSVLRAGVRVEQNRNQHDTVAEQDCNQCLPPIHTSADQSRRQHVSWDAMRHADP